LPNKDEVKIQLKRSRKHKLCITCKEDKPLSAFYKKATSIDKRCSECKQCDSIRRQLIYSNRTTQRISDTRIDNTCIKCNRLLPIDQFHFTSAIKGGRSNICKACTNIDTRQYYSQPDKRASRVLNSIRKRANKLNIAFSLTVSDLVIPDICPILNIPLLINSSSRDNWPSVDRIIPSLGYIKDNIIVISYRANRIKNDASIEELEAIASFYKDILKNKLSIIPL
jgi:hypothetical protein